VSKRQRQHRGETTGRLECGKCGQEKLVAGFSRDPACGWSYWCKACHREYHRGAGRDERVIWTRVDPDVAEYMMRNMLPNTMAKSAGQLARKIIEDAVQAHRHACVALRTPPVPSKAGWPTRAQLMGRR
jgi:hypothetical protein